MFDRVEFAHKEFLKESWGDEVKNLISSLVIDDNVVWHKKHRSLKKINEELSTLGYYVKYKYSKAEGVSFYLNQAQGKIDGYICQNGCIIETVQIVITFYDKEESQRDKDLMEGKNSTECGWVEENLNFIKERIKDRINLKIDKCYKGIDTLLIGTRHWFVSRISKDQYIEFCSEIREHVTTLSPIHNFEQIAIVDTDYMGKGSYIAFP